MDDTATLSLLATLSINGAICVLTLSLFECQRNKEKEIFSPRLQDAQDILDPKNLSFVQCIKISWCVDDDQFLRLCGVDAYVFLRFLKLCARMCIICTIFGFVVLVPVFATGGIDDTLGVSRYSMGNIEVGNQRLWTPFFFTYLFAISFLRALELEYQHFVQTRQLFLESGGADGNAQTRYSVQIENIPPPYRSEDKLFEFANSIFENDIASASVFIHTPKLDSLCSRRQVVISNIEATTAVIEANPDRERPTKRVKKGKAALTGGDKADELEFWRSELATLDVAISAAQMQAWSKARNSISDHAAAGLDWRDITTKIPGMTDDADTVSSTGVITFKTRRTQATACQVPVLSKAHTAMRVQPAPAPEDIVWSNVTFSVEYTEVASVGTSLLLYTGLAFWGAVLAFVAAISNLNNLAKFLPFLNDLDPTSYAVLAGQLPVVVLIVFISSLPLIMGFIAEKVEKRKTYSGIQQQVFKWFFLYQIANVYVLLVAGSIFNALAEAIADPASIVTLLGTALPSVSVFFINFIITQIFSGIPLLLLRIGSLAMMKIYRHLVGEKYLYRRMLLEGPLAPLNPDYGTSLPPLLYVFTITQLYWVIAPLLTLASTLFFGASYVAWKYLYIFVIVRKFESGGLFWYGLVDFAVVGLLASIITMIGYMGVKEGVLQVPLLLPLPILVLLWWRRADKKYRVLSQHLPFSSAVDSDKANNATSSPVSLSALALSHHSKAAPAIPMIPHATHSEHGMNYAHRGLGPYTDEWHLAPPRSGGGGGGGSGGGDGSSSKDDDQQHDGYSILSMGDGGGLQSSASLTSSRTSSRAGGGGGGAAVAGGGDAYRQPNLRAAPHDLAQAPEPFPYRIDGTPLLDPVDGALNAVYLPTPPAGTMRHRTAPGHVGQGQGQGQDGASVFTRSGAWALLSGGELEALGLRTRSNGPGPSGEGRRTTATAGGGGGGAAEAADEERFRLENDFSVGEGVGGLRPWDYFGLTTDVEMDGSLTLSSMPSDPKRPLLINA